MTNAIIIRDEQAGNAHEEASKTSGSSPPQERCFDREWSFIDYLGWLSPDDCEQALEDVVTFGRFLAKVRPLPLSERERALDVVGALVSVLALPADTRRQVIDHLSAREAGR